MIIGNGDIAKVLPDRDDLLFFAAGVSNSQETDEAEYDREVRLLKAQSPGQHLVYFSSLGVLDRHTRYIDHKRQMELRVQQLFDTWTIVRIGNITWGTNPHTLINFLRAQADRGEPMNVQNVHRYLVDEPEFLYWIGLIPAWNCEMNIPGRRMLVKDIVAEYV